MKVYAFCFNEDVYSTYSELMPIYNLEDIIVNDKVYYLHAWTTSKKLYKVFKLERNMSIFTIIVFDMSDNKYRLFKNKNWSYELKNTDIAYDNRCTDYRKMVITDSEVDITNEVSDDFYIILSGMYDEYITARIFNTKYIKLLNDIKYFKLMKLSKRLDEGEHISIVESLYSQREMFMYVFSDLMKNKKGNKYDII